jgi:hypothetical protein
MNPIDPTDQAEMFSPLCLLLARLEVQIAELTRTREELLEFILELERNAN